MNQPIFCRHRFLIFVTLACFSCSQLALGNDTDEIKNRVAAEWEPAIGVLIGWPLVLPEQLVIDLAKHEKLYVVMETVDEKDEAARKLAELNIPNERVEFVYGDPENSNDAPKTDKDDQSADESKSSIGDTVEMAEGNSNEIYKKIHIWTRDWGPFAGFSDDGKYHLIDPIFADYPLSKLPCNSKLEYFPDARTKDWNRDETARLSKILGVDVRHAPAFFVGGNLMFDGVGTAMSTCLSVNENQTHGIDRKQFLNVAAQSFGVEKYHIIPNFEDLGIQHIDCLLKFIGDNRILIARSPLGHKHFNRYQDIVAQIAQLKNVNGQRYRIYRINCGEFDYQSETEGMGKGIAAYTNSLILNKRIFVPLYGIETDKPALETWKLAMPGYEVTGYEFTKKTGSPIPWQSFDALHCRTRAVWDPKMLFMAREDATDSILNAKQYTLSANIKDYSQSGLIAESLQLYWRVTGTAIWKTTSLHSSERPNVYSGSFAGPQSGETIEYYFSAADRSDRSETLPRTAPSNTFRLRIR